MSESVSEYVRECMLCMREERRGAAQRESERVRENERERKREGERKRERVICLGGGGIAVVGLCVVEAGRWKKVAVKDRYVFSDGGPYRSAC